MEIDGILLEIDKLTKDANNIKNTTLDRLANDEIITEEQHDEYSEKWNVVVVKKSWFKKWKDKFAKGEKDGYIYKLVKFEE